MKGRGSLRPQARPSGRARRGRLLKRSVATVAAAVVVLLTPQVASAHDDEDDAKYTASRSSGR